MTEPTGTSILKTAAGVALGLLFTIAAIYVIHTMTSDPTGDSIHQLSDSLCQYEIENKLPRNDC